MNRIIAKFAQLICCLPLCLILWCQGAQAAPQTVLVVGDSLSAEYGLSRGTGWVSLLEKRLKQEGKAVQVINASISGDTTQGAVARLPMLLKQYRPTVVILEIGGNDGLRGMPIKTVRNNLEKMIRMSQEAGSRVLLLGMQMPPNYGAAYTKQFTELYGQLAQQWRTGLVPFFLAGIAQSNRYFQADRLHPTREAQPILLDNVWPHLMPLLK